MIVMPFTLKIEHSIDNMLEGFRTGKRAIFRDVTHQDNRHVSPLCGKQQVRRHLAQLKKNCRRGDLSCRRKQRQALLHWAYDSRKI